MSVQKSCAECDKLYAVPERRAASSRFCSRACKDLNGRTAERRALICENCKEGFVSTKDHGAWPRFCSRDCFLSACVRPEDRACAHCGGMFVSAGSSTSTCGRRLYCSPKCAHEGKKRGEAETCLNCGNSFYRQPSLQKGCCSSACAHEFYRGDRSAGWKGGKYLATQSNQTMVRLERPGYVGPYIGEHRLIASKAIGRMLWRHEYVIHVSREKDDNSADNLFICASISEYARRRNGSLPWPTTSNLNTYGDRESKTPSDRSPGA